MATLTHPVRWQAPQPMWARFGADAAAAAASSAQSRPSLLRFATDDFMDHMLATLARDPAQIDSYVACAETWKKPVGAPVDLIERTPVPRLMQGAVRTFAARQTKSRIALTAPTPGLPLKLYQPAHQRHYLVSASLICAQPGLPERAVATGGGEQVNFVIRRLLPDVGATSSTAPPTEFAYIKDATSAHWQRIGDSDAAGQAVAGEELLPVFPLGYHDDAQHARTLWTSSVPVGRREEYMATAVNRTAALSFAQGQQQSLSVPATAAAPTVKLARVTQFQMEVAEPWKTQIRSAFKTSDTLLETSEASGGPESPTAKDKRAFDFNLQQQNVSWLILLDLAAYLEAYLPDLWSVIQSDGAGASALPDARKRIHDWLLGATMPPGLVTGLRPPGTFIDLRAPSPSMRAALKAIRAAGVSDKLEALQLNYDSSNTSDAGWPPFHFVLAGVEAATWAPVGPFTHLPALAAAQAGIPEPDPDAGPTPAAPTPAEQALQAAVDAAAQVDRLTSLVGLALDDTGDAAAPPLPFALQMKNAIKDTTNDPGWFVIRFVYTRRDCGPLHPPLVSPPTEPFQLAGFFDPDAPARPIRITLPLDTSPSGLRKFNKNTAFVLSDMLCGQVQRAKGLGFIDLVRQVLPWPLHKDLDVGSGSCQTSGGINIGMICSLSIPIITICALILLIIIVALLDFIFRWLPFFIICFPVPGLKGKK